MHVPPQRRDATQPSRTRDGRCTFYAHHPDRVPDGWTQASSAHLWAWLDILSVSGVGSIDERCEIPSRMASIGNMSPSWPTPLPRAAGWGGDIAVPSRAGRTAMTTVLIVLLGVAIDLVFVGLTAAILLHARTLLRVARWPLARDTPRTP
jgi:hypothetical protein